MSVLLNSTVQLLFIHYILYMGYVLVGFPMIHTDCFQWSSIQIWIKAHPNPVILTIAVLFAALSSLQLPEGTLRE